ncbi:MAG TPA: hypothetical protein VNH21_12340 [Steroidobacteraceae bacterium]|nr:hypothetical protein [Steroidobacteraceae bacterium]
MGDVLHATDLNSAIAAAAAGAGPGLPIAGIAGYLFGLTMSNDVGTPDTLLDIAAGACADSTGTVMITLGAFTKSIAGAWAAGSGQNGMGGGLTATASTWYHVFACINAGVSDVFFDTSATGSHAPIGTTALRRIGSIRLDPLVHILSFSQMGDRFDRGAPLQEFNGVPGATTAATVTLAGVPAGLPIQALLTGYGVDATPAQGILYVSSLSQADNAPTLGGAYMTAQWGINLGNVTTFAATVPTNASAQVRRRVSTATCTIIINSVGWIDQRGRF